MSGSYRSIILAFGLILIGAGEPPKNATQSKKDQAQTDQKQSAPSVVIGNPSSPPQDRGCKRGEDSRESDLCAQWKAADAAADAAYWSWLQMIAGFMGLVVGGGTLFAAWRAAHWAKEAAKHTETSATESRAATKAMQESNRISNEAQRAWVTIRIVPVAINSTPIGLDIKIGVIAENIGQSIATHFDIQADVLFKGQTEIFTDFIDRVDAKISDWSMGTPAGVNSSLLPKDSETETKLFRFPHDKVQWWNAGSRKRPTFQAVVVACVVYRTVGAPDLMQVSTRSAYLGERVDGETISFQVKQGSKLRGDEIATDPFHMTLSHREHTANDDRRQRGQ